MNSDCAETDDGSLALAFLSLRFLSASQILFSSNWEAPHGLTQVHNQPTRQDTILDLVFTNNPSLVKSSYSIPGISDHAMVVTDCDINLFIINKIHGQYTCFLKPTERKFILLVKDCL